MPIHINNFGGSLVFFLRKYCSSLTSRLMLSFAAKKYEPNISKYINTYFNTCASDHFNSGEKLCPLFLNCMIETVNRCNGSCAFCPASKKTESRPFKMMTNELFYRIIDELAELSESTDWDWHGKLFLNVNNEPLLDPRILDFAAYAKERIPGIWIEVITNGTLLTTTSKSSLTIMSATSSATLSSTSSALLDSTPPRRHESALHQGLEHTISSDASLCSSVQSKGINERDRNSIHNMIGKIDRLIINDYGATYSLSEPHRSIYREIKSHPEAFANIDVIINRRLGNEILATRAGFAPNKPVRQGNSVIGACIYPFTDLVIFPDGKVGMCCNDCEENTDFGNVKDNSLVDIWFNDKFRNLRAAMATGDRQNYGFCKECDVVDAGGREKQIKEMLLFHREKQGIFRKAGEKWIKIQRFMLQELQVW